MPIRHANLAKHFWILGAGLLSGGFLLFTVNGQHLTSAQEKKQSEEVAKSGGNAKRIARGRYIVEGLAGCGYCHTPRGENGEPDRAKWLAGAPVFYQPSQRVSGWPTMAPRLAGLPPGSDTEMITLLTTSVSRSGKALRAPMPRFRMTRVDAEAVVAYLRSLNSSQ
jgi:mono/diheme cytochrome c family protein